MSCQCGGKSFLHKADCEVVVSRNRTAYHYLKNVADVEPYTRFLYVCHNAKVSFDALKELLGDNWAMTGELRGTYTVFLVNGSEVVFAENTPSHQELLRGRVLDGALTDFEELVPSLISLTQTKNGWVKVVDQETKEVK